MPVVVRTVRSEGREEVWKAARQGGRRDRERMVSRPSKCAIIAEVQD